MLISDVADTSSTSPCPVFLQCAHARASAPLSLRGSRSFNTTMSTSPLIKKLLQLPRWLAPVLVHLLSRGNLS